MPGHWASWPRRCVRRCVQGLSVGLLAGRIGPLARAWCCLWQVLRSKLQMPGEEEGGGRGLLVSLSLLSLLSLTREMMLLGCHQRHSGKEECGGRKQRGRELRVLVPSARSRLGDMGSGRWGAGRKVAKGSRHTPSGISGIKTLILALFGKF